MKTSIRVLVLAFAILSLNGCRLRGEQHSLSEMYTDAQNSYSSVSQDGVSQEAKNSLKTISDNLALAGQQPAANKITSSAAQVGEAITTLLPSAGYTVRPGLTELRNQYLELKKLDTVSNDQFTLLATRTYALLASELQTTKFGIKAY